MAQASTIGLYIAKRVFQAHGADAAGRVVFRKRLVRAKPDLNSAPAQLAEFRPIFQLTWRLWCQHRSHCEFRSRFQLLNGG